MPSLAGILGDHDKYYKYSPLFMPRFNSDPQGDFQEWLQHPGNHAWAAYREARPTGYMQIQPTAESFVSEHGGMMNITGAYVAEEERKSGIGTLLLDEVQKWLAREGYPLCGVDFEGINLLGSPFWHKYFTPYSYTLVRRIDERVLHNNS